MSNQIQQLSEVEKYIWREINHLTELGFSAEMIVEILGDRARQMLAGANAPSPQYPGHETPPARTHR